LAGFEVTIEDLVFFAGLSLLLTIGAVYLVSSGLVTVLTEFKGLFLIAGIVLLYVSGFFGLRAYADRRSPPKQRLMILFGPALSCASAGLAAIFMGIIPRVLSEEFLWIAGILGLLSLVSFQVALVFSALIVWEKRKNQRL